VVGESVEVAGWRLEVLAAEKRAITRLRLVPADHQKPDSSDG
jgi:CBS domain containing-hemolysin-like protein